MLGLLTATVYFAGTIYWTGTVIITFGDVNPIAAMVGMTLLSAYLALYPAVASLVTSRLIARLGAAGLFIAPMAWVATEYLRGYFLTGFPWVPLGNSQVTVLPVAQLASVLGVYGLSALVAYINTTLAYSLVTSGTQRVVAVASAVVVLVVVGGWGAWRIADGSLTPPTNQECPPGACSLNQIRKVNVTLTARSRSQYSVTKQFFRNSLSTQVSLRGMAFVNDYVQ